MDVWIIAAAVGAGFVAKCYNKKLTMGTVAKCNCSDSSYENLEIAPESLGTVKKVHESFGENICRQREEDLHNASAVETASTSGSHGEDLVMSDDFGSWTNGDITSNLMPRPLSSEIRFSYGFRQNRSSLRSRRVNSKLLKPRTSLDSCLMAQLYKEHAETEGYTYCVHTPLEPAVGPLLVTDGSGIISRNGSGIISRASQQFCSRQSRTGNYNKNMLTQESRTLLCVASLSNAVSVELQTGDKAKFGKESVSLRSNTSKMVKKRQDNEQGSSSDSTLLFYLGLTMGVTYSSLRHKLEMDKLTKSLKQTEDLVEDLQEELEMKDASTVKELAVEDYESLDVHNDSYFNDSMQALSPEQKLDSSSRHCSDEYCDRNAKEESLRKIEAELEAELDRLASNMNSARLEGKLSNVDELDPDFVPDVIEGDLRADLFGAKTHTQPYYADRGGSGSSTTTTRSGHYPVSPRELTLRLHKVIQSRLEERVRELETALEQSQMKIECMKESESKQFVDRPVVINLSGEAESAYNEAFEELTKLSESEEEEIEHRRVVISRTSKQDDDSGVVDGYVISNRSSRTGFSSRQEEDARVNVSKDVLCNSRDESDDEMEKLLIKQIVEKARQGSPAVLKVQRAFLSSDENINWHQFN